LWAGSAPPGSTSQGATSPPSVWTVWCYPLQERKPFSLLSFRIKKALFKRLSTTPIVLMDKQMRRRGEVVGFLHQFCFEGPHLARLRRSHLLWLLGLRRTSVLRKRSARATFGALPFLLQISHLASLASHSPQSDHTGPSGGINLFLWEVGQRCQGVPGYPAVHGKLPLKLKTLPAIDRC